MGFSASLMSNDAKGGHLMSHQSEIKRYSQLKCTAF